MVVYAEKDLKGKSGIYKWTSPDGNSYVGLAKDLGSRHKDFRCATKTRYYVGKGSVIDKARQKYPYKEWIYEVLEFCTVDKLGEREKYYISKYNTLTPNGYNITSGGIGGCGVPKSAFKKGHKSTEEQMQKKLETHRRHLEEGIIDYKWASKPVALYSIDGVFIKRFDREKDLAEFICYKGNFTNVIKNNYLVKKKYMVRYADENTPLFIEPYVKRKVTFSAETREKMSKAKKGRKFEWSRKLVSAINIDTGIRESFDGIVEAAEKIIERLKNNNADQVPTKKSAQKNIQSALKGRRKSAYGYAEWEYLTI